MSLNQKTQIRRQIHSLKIIPLENHTDNIEEQDTFREEKLETKMKNQRKMNSLQIIPLDNHANKKIIDQIEDLDIIWEKKPETRMKNQRKMKSLQIVPKLKNYSFIKNHSNKEIIDQIEDLDEIQGHKRKWGSLRIVHLQSHPDKEIRDQIKDLQKLKKMFFKDLKSTKPEIKNKSIRDTKPYIGTLEEYPARDLANQYILTGYRINFRTFLLSLKSLCIKNNEIGNIITHLVPLVWFIIETWDIIKEENEFNQAEEEDTRVASKYPLLVYMLSVNILLWFSVQYHWFHDIHPLDCFLMRVDFSGIVLCIMCNGILYESYAFYCEPLEKLFYTLVLLIIGFTVFMIAILESMQQRKYNTLRALMFILQAVLSYITVIHAIIYRMLYYTPEGDYLEIYPSLKWIGLSLLCFLIASISYIIKWPEIKYPKTFDIIGQSHQIMHIFFAIGYYFMYQCGLSLYKDRLERPCQA